MAEMPSSSPSALAEPGNAVAVLGTGIMGSAMTGCRCWKHCPGSGAQPLRLATAGTTSALHAWPWAIRFVTIREVRCQRMW